MAKKAVRPDKKAILLISDGLGDRPNQELGGKTPLEYAHTPTLDRLAAAGMTGLVHPYQVGTRCGTDWGHICLFGYDPSKYYTGRGSIEAYSAGMELEPGDVAFRGNLGTVDDNLVVVDRRAGRIKEKEDIDELLEAVNGIEVEGYKLLLRSLTEHRLAVVIRGPGLGGSIEDVDPGTACEGQPVVNPYESAVGEDNKKTAEMIYKLLLKVHEIWKDHPVNKRRVEAGKLPGNFILCRGSGKAMVLPPFTSMYKGAKVAVIAGDDTITGIGRMCGFDGYREDTFTGGFDTDYAGKAKLALKLSEDYDLVIVHVKGTDLCGHDNLPFKKAEIIEKIDTMFAYWTSETVGKDYYYGMIADHSTPCVRRDHSADPVPVFLTGSDVRVDDVKVYGERACKDGILNQYTGATFMATIMDYLWYSKKYGA